MPGGRGWAPLELTDAFCTSVHSVSCLPHFHYSSHQIASTHAVRLAHAPPAAAKETFWRVLMFYARWLPTYDSLIEVLNVLLTFNKDN